MPAQTAADLLVAFERLPPRAARYRTKEGVLFLRELKAACDMYGARQVGEAIGLSVSAVYQIRHRELPRKVYVYPDEEQMLEVRKAWRAILSLKARHRQVRRTTTEFKRMQAALLALRRRTGTDDVMIAVALGVEAAQLRVFEEPARTPKPLQVRG